MITLKNKAGRVFSLFIVTLNIILACCTAASAESSQQQIAPAKVTAVIHCNYPPITFWDKTVDRPAGFAVEIINSVAKRVGLEVDYICKSGWPEMISSVETGEAAVSVLFKSAEREKILLFSSPIEISYLSYFGRSQSAVNPDTLPMGVTVGVIKGGRSFEQLKNLPGVKLVVQGTYQEGFFNLLAGQIAIFAGEDSMMQKQAREAGLEGHIKKIGKSFLEQERCLVVRHDNGQLLERLNNSLKGFTGSPEYQRIYLKWYGAPVPYWTIEKIFIVCGLFLLIVICGMAYWRYNSILRINRELVRIMDERQRTDESRRESEDKFRSIFENANDGIMIADAETKRHIEANKAICSMLGYTRNEIVGLSMDDVHPQEDLPAIQSLFEKQLRGEISLAPKIPMLRKDGSIFYADINATHVTLSQKPCLVGIFRDITERKKTEEILREREKQLAESQRIAHIGSWEHNLTTGKVVWSDELFRILGLDPRKDPADFKMFFAMIHPEDQPLLQKGIEETVKTGKKFSVDYRFNLPDGRTRILLAQAELICDEIGTQRILHGTGQDITERKQADEKVRQSESNYRYLFESLTDGIFIIDLDGNFINVNTTAFMRLGYMKEEMLALPLSKLDHPAFVSLIPERLAQIRECGSSTVFESVHLRKDGTAMPVEVNARLIEYEGKVVYFCVVRDITERKLVEQALEKAHAELEQRVSERTAELEYANIKLKELDRLKSMFIASMSHELRTPLNSIIGFSSILVDEWLGPLSEEQKMNLESVLISGKHLLSLINDMIDVSKIEAGKFEITIDEFELSDVLIEAADLFTKEIHDKGFEFVFEPLNLQIRTDRRRLCQCLINLLSNAVKFMECGTIGMTARLISPGLIGGRPAGDLVEIAVADTGIGIREEDIPKLFNAFVRLVPPEHMSIKGTGLGLYLTRKIAGEVLGGEIVVESLFGKGSCFTLRIPAILQEKKRVNEAGAVDYGLAAIVAKTGEAGEILSEIKLS